MPRLWTETIAAHRVAVQDAVLDAVAALVAEHGLASVSMSQIAERTGIGRATLYKYFPDIQAVLTAWHERQITRHLARLTQAKDAARSGPRGQLQAVLEAYALGMHQRQHHGSELAALLHQSEHVARAQQELHAFITGLVADAALEGEVRDDIAPSELASYCLHALTAASSLPSQAAARRLVSVTLDGLCPLPDQPDITHADGYVYVCGGQPMRGAVRAAFTDVITEHGWLPREHAEARVHDLETTARYRPDLWG